MLVPKRTLDPTTSQVAIPCFDCRSVCNVFEFSFRSARLFRSIASIFESIFNLETSISRIFVASLVPPHHHVQVSIAVTEVAL